VISMQIEVLNDRQIRIGKYVFNGERINNSLEVFVPVKVLEPVSFGEIPIGVRIIADITPLLPSGVTNRLIYGFSCSTDVLITKSGIIYIFDLIYRYYHGVVSIGLFFDAALRIASALGFRILDKTKNTYYMSAELFFQAKTEENVLRTLERSVIYLLKLISRLGSFLEEKIQSFLEEFLKKQLYQ